MKQLTLITLLTSAMVALLTAQGATAGAPPVKPKPKPKVIVSNTCNSQVCVLKFSDGTQKIVKK